MSVELLTGRTALWSGALFIVTGELMFASMGVAIRFAAAELPNESIVFFRNLLGLLILAPWLLGRGREGLRTPVPHLHLLRGVAGVSAMYCFFYAIAHMPLADAMLLKLTAPLFIPLVALAWLREEVGPRVWLALGIGYAGVIVVLRPGTDIPPVALVALMGGFFAAIAKVTVRRLARSEPSLRIVFYFALIAALISAVPMSWAWQTPTLTGFLWLVGVAAFATLGQLCLTRALALAPAARMGAFGDFAVVFGALYGWVFWSEPLLWWTVAGSALILLAGLLPGRGPRGSLPPAAVRAVGS
jgi:drug/metabolite transporter (DMT)-like permease